MVLRNAAFVMFDRFVHIWCPATSTKVDCVLLTYKVDESYCLDQEAILPSESAEVAT